jgi:hypothetical protein
MVVREPFGSSRNFLARLLSNWFGVQVPGRSPEGTGSSVRMVLFFVGSSTTHVVDTCTAPNAVRCKCVAYCGWKPHQLTRDRLIGKRGTNIFLQNPDSPREVLHYMRLKNRRDELIWGLILRNNPFALSRGYYAGDDVARRKGTIYRAPTRSSGTSEKRIHLVVPSYTYTTLQNSFLETSPKRIFPWE